MKTFSTLSSLFLIGTLGFLASSWLSSGNITLDLSDEEPYLYL